MKNKTEMFGTAKSDLQKNSPYHNTNAIEQSKLHANNLDNDDELYCNWTLDDYHLLTNWYKAGHNDWSLPATQEPHWWCGMWSTRGCLHSEDHHNKNNKVYIKRYQRSCFRARCKICWEKWIGRQSNVATRKIEKYSKRENISPLHIVLSISNWDYELDYKKMKQKARKILREIKIRGGSIIFHPFRFNKKIRCWYYSPHFHVVCFGFLPKGALAETYHQNGWFVKYLGVRKSVFATFYYLFSHCGIRHRIRSVSWFGDLSYSKLEKEILPVYDKCPLCKRKLMEIYYKGWDPPFASESFFEGFVDALGWYAVETENIHLGPCDFEYAPTRELNDLLQSLEQAR